MKLPKVNYTKVSPSKRVIASKTVSSNKTVKSDPKSTHGGHVNGNSSK